MCTTEEEATYNLMMLRRTTLFTALSLLLLYGLSGCVYYNTFYNAKKEFNTAEKMRKQSGTGSQSIARSTSA